MCRSLMSGWLLSAFLAESTAPVVHVTLDSGKTDEPWTLGGETFFLRVIKLRDCLAVQSRERAGATKGSRLARRQVLS